MALEAVSIPVGEPPSVTSGLGHDGGDELLWKNLVRAITGSGKAWVHPDLVLRRSCSSSAPGLQNHPQSPYHHARRGDRGVYTCREITAGTLLLRLPKRYALSGRNLPDRYPTFIQSLSAYSSSSSNSDSTPEHDVHHEGNGKGPSPIRLETHQHHVASAATTNSRSASTWLRCLAALDQAFQQQQHPSTPPSRNIHNETPVGGGEESSGNEMKMVMKAYVDSLPALRHMETWRQWTPAQRQHYLAGTTLLDEWRQAHGLINVPEREPGSAGTSPHQAPSSDTTTRPGAHSGIEVQRYHEQIRPYLHYCRAQNKGITTTTSHIMGPELTVEHSSKDGSLPPTESEVETFLYYCDLLSTRAFHLQSVPEPSTSVPTSNASKFEYNDLPDRQDQDGDRTPVAQVAPSVGINVGDSSSRSGTKPQAASQVKLSLEGTAPYHGPYMLPLIDLMNHSSDPQKCCTTLQLLRPSQSTELGSETYQDDDNDNDDDGECFVLKAGRNVAAHEEILHAYGHDLTAHQFLHTFGFVPEEAMENAVQSYQRLVHEHAQVQKNQPLLESDAEFVLSRNATPAMLTKQEILEACWQLIDSGFPEKLAQSMRDRNIPDEVWTVSVDRTRNTSWIPETLLVGPAEEDGVLSRPLVTLACLPFLPVCAFREAVRTWLDSSLLMDYYLGTLVSRALLNVVQEKLASYSQVPTSQLPKVLCDSDVSMGECKQDDATILARLLRETSATISTQTDRQETSTGEVSTLRLMYGLTVRIEEKLCLLTLRRAIMKVLVHLEDETDAMEESVNDDSGAKKIRPSIDS